MHRIAIILVLALLFALQPALLRAQDAPSKTYSIKEVAVRGYRPMKEIGVQKTQFDSAVLKENIALSMADVLTFNSSIFVKSYGRATLSTVAFRGTSPSHTQVTWNGMRINNPMLGMTDFSTIPAYFVDKASLLHGTSSVNETGGGLGGLVKLGTSSQVPDGFSFQYVQGVGSFCTFDEFARFSYGSEHWQVSTRAVYSASPNDFPYINHDKKINIYDDEKNIIGRYHPKERNKSASFKDFHILQEAYYDSRRGDRVGLNVWYLQTNRELPMLTTDYGEAAEFDNRQRERTLRSVVSWDHLQSSWKVGAKAGYIYTWMAYDYKREVAPGNWGHMTRSRSEINTLYGQADGEYNPTKHWFFSVSIAAHQHFVISKDKNIILRDGGRAIVGYDKARIELSGLVSAKWQPLERLGMSVVVREEMYGTERMPIIPAFFVDCLVSKAGTVMAKASVSRNHRFPTLNDLYFLPGGNPNLKSEHGVTYDAGLSCLFGGHDAPYRISGSANWFDSYIDDWIIWLPTTKGFFSPRNVKKVHAYGVELQSSIQWRFPYGWSLELNGTYAWTPSINVGEKMSPADQSLGKQLPYVPEHSATCTGRLSWRGWAFLYKWAYYSQRFTMSSNDFSFTGHLPDYFMSNVSLEKNLYFKWLDLQLKLAVNNLFNEEYLSVLSRPMPRINFEFFVGITPKFKNWRRARKVEAMPAANGA